MFGGSLNVTMWVWIGGIIGITFSAISRHVGYITQLTVFNPSSLFPVEFETLQENDLSIVLI
jgi:hypothetical protein